MKAPGRIKRANGVASCAAALSLLAAVTLGLIPFSTPASADDRPRPPATRDDVSRRQEAERERVIGDEQKRQAELQRNVQALQANALRREIERQTERVRHESIAAATRADRRPERVATKPVGPTASIPISLQACNGSTPPEALAPVGESSLLIGKGWITKNRGLGEAFIQGTRVELSIGGVAIANAERFFADPAPLDHPVLGRVWITRWEYPFTMTTPAPTVVSVRWTLEGRLANLAIFNEDGTPLRHPTDFSAALSCTLVPAVSVSGRITGAGVGLSDGRVGALDATTSLVRAPADTNASGEFMLLLQPGNYRFRFSSLAGPWLPEFWDDRATFNEATIVTLAFGVTPPRLLVDLERGVFVSGRVTDADTDQPVPGVGVSAQRVDLVCCQGFFASTDADGRYRVVVRKNVTLKVGFFPRSVEAYLEQWWNARPSFGEADLLVIGTTDVANVDAALERGVFVRGRVSDAETGLPLANAGVSASVVSTTCCQNFFASTDAQGDYAMAVRKNVSIVVGFFPPVSPVPYIPSYWNGRRSFSEADQLAVGTLDISGINGALEHGVFLRGRVTDAETGAGVGRATVVASVGTCCGESFFAFTAADGTYVTAIRKNVTLRVQFFGPFGGPYVAQWFRGRATLGDADPVPVSTADVAGIDAALERGVFLRGRVTDAGTGDAIAQANISASVAGVPCCQTTFASTNALGDYAVVVRKNVSVIVAFTAPFGSTVPYLPQWYDGKSTSATANAVPVSSSDVLGINAALERGVFVRGRVIDAGTLEPIAGAGVLALDLAPPCCAGTFASTDSRGEYRVVARKNVGLKINFSPPFRGPLPYIGQWYRAKASFDAADVVPVALTDVLGIDAALERGVFLRGRVTDALLGDGLANAGVNAQRVDVLSCCETYFASTDADGRYAMAVKRGISVKVGFFPPFNDPVPHLREWWNDRRIFQDADPLLIGSSDIPSIDAALERGVFVRGRVTDALSGSGLANAGVNAQRVDSLCCEFYSASTDTEGRYAMTVRSGISVKVGFSPPFNDPVPHLSEWWNDRRTFQDADPLPIGDGDATGIDAALEHGVFIRGRVTNESGDGLAQVFVSASVLGGPCCEGYFAFSGTTGDYAMPVRQNVDVKVAFFPPFGSDLLLEYYNNKPDFGTADVVPVGVIDVTGINAALERGVRLSGTVSDAAGAAIAGVNVNVQTETGAFVAFAQTANDGGYSVVLRPGRYKVAFFPPFGSDLLFEYYNNKFLLDAADVVVVGTAAVGGIDAVLESTRDLTPPTILDARIAQNVGLSDFGDLDDTFTLVFSEAMNTATTGDTLQIQDQDGTTVTLRCGVAPNNVACDWNPAGTAVTVTLDANLDEVPAFGSPGSGTTPGLQIPFNITAMTGFSDGSGNVPDILGSPDRLVDFESP